MLALMRLACRFAAPALLAVVLALPAAAPAQQTVTPFAPVAVVNGVPITGFDLEQRVRLLRLLTDAGGDAATLGRAALDQLIEDRLKLQAAGRRGIEPTDELVAGGLASFARARGMEPDALLERLRGAGISPLALSDLIRAEVVWLELVRSRFGDRAEPSAGELDAQVGAIAQSAGAGAADLSPEQREELRRRMIEQRLGGLADGLMQELRRDALIERR